MTTLTVQSTWSIGPVSHRMNLRDLDLVDTGSGSVLYGTNGASGGLVSARIDPATGALVFADSLTLPPVAAVGAPAHLEPVTIDGTPMLVSLGQHTADLSAVSVTLSGDLSGVSVLAGGDSAAISTLAFHSATTRDVAYAGYWGNSDLGIYQVGQAGALTLLGNIRSGHAVHGADLVDFRVTQVQGQDVLLVASRYQDAVFSYTINQNGGLAVADVVRMQDGLPVSGPSALEIIEAGSARYAVMAASGTSSLTVLDVSASGHMTPVDHVNAGTNTRIQTVTALDTVSYADRHYVLAGGANDGVSLFQVLPDGRLYHLDAQEDLPSTALANVTSIAAQVRGSGLDIYVGSESEAGITQLRYELGAQAPSQHGSAGNDTLTGNASGDYLIGNAGNDRLDGGAGADILLDGAGQDTLTGGTGADIFILSRDGSRDSITDFDPAQDRLDLSGWGRIYDTSSLTWSVRGAGAVITCGEEMLIINTVDGTPLSPDSFAPSEIFNLSHTDLSYMIGGSDPLADDTEIGTFEGSAGRDTLDGTARDDRLRGHAGDDRIFGSAGNDVLNGGPGADYLDGGIGSDWASYEGSRGSLRVDLMFAQINTNVAQGDSYVSIENLRGSQGFDNLRGTLGDNVIQGGRNVDYIFGRRGNDTLEGGIGDDVLFGGVGADVLRGGDNRDRAQYSEATSAVRIDLQFAETNLGEAQGDSYDSIEDLAGGKFDDLIFGDAGANRLFGREGADLLTGRAGDDYLNGGAHADTLDGGAGNDVLRGGQNADVFVFREGLDTVQDFDSAMDILLLDPDVLGGGAATPTRALEFAGVVGSHLVFDFGSDDQITLWNIADSTDVLGNIQFM